MSEPLSIVDRLRGIYRIPITDGLGPVEGSQEPDNAEQFVRRFPSTPIMEEAADAIEILVAALKPLACPCRHDYRECGYSECPEGNARAALDKVRSMK